MIITLSCILLSTIINPQKTYTGIKRGLNMLLKILPVFLNVLIIVSFSLYLVPNELIVRYLGENTGFLGIFLASIIGAVALIPAFISYPLAAILLKQGVSYPVVAAFITTLMMVGIITLPVEIKFFGIRAALARNALSFIGAIIIALLIGLSI